MGGAYLQPVDCSSPHSTVRIWCSQGETGCPIDHTSIFYWSTSPFSLVNTSVFIGNHLDFSWSTPPFFDRSIFRFFTSIFFANTSISLVNTSIFIGQHLDFRCSTPRFSLANTSTLIPPGPGPVWHPAPTWRCRSIISPPQEPPEAESAKREP